MSVVAVRSDRAIHSPDLLASKFYGQALGLISTGQLNVLPRFHTQPINVVVYHESHWQD